MCMMLWGVTLFPGNVFTGIIEYDVHLSMAALETRRGHGGKFQGQAQVVLQTDQGEFVVCTLIFGSVLQQNLNLKITAGEKVTLYSEGKGIIHLTGQAMIGTSMKVDDGNRNVMLSTNHDSSKNDAEEALKSTESDIDSGGEDCWQAVYNSEMIIKEEPPDSDKERVPADEEEDRLTPAASEHSNNGELCEMETSQDTLPLTGQERKSNGRNAKKMATVVCEECGKSFQSNALLKCHMASHKTERAHKCETCSKEFKSMSGLHVHLRTHTGEKPYECQTCSKAFSDQGTCRRHEKIHSGATPFRCKYCGKGFPENAPLVRHIRIHTGEKPFPCTSCPKWFSDKGQLKRHGRSHLKGEARAVYNGQCDVCGKILQDASSLRKHRLLHTDLKPYICSLCNKAFNDQSTLRQHIRMHNRSRNQEKELSCIYCPAKYKTIKDWNDHSRTCSSVNSSDITLEIENVALNPVIKEEII